MKKNIKKPQNSNNKTNSYSIGMELPEVINMDSLCFFDDDSLVRLHGHLQSEREKVARYTEDLLPWEVEICYVQREMKIRNVRRIAHEKYVRNNPDAYYYDTASSQDEFELQES